MSALTFQALRTLADGRFHSGEDMARSLGKSARILKSEAKAMKEEGKQSGTAESAEEPAPAQRTIQAAPGDVTSSRPVNEPTDTTQR